MGVTRGRLDDANATTRLVTSPRARASDRKAEPSGFASLSDLGSLLALVQNLREGIYITDANDVVLDANPAFLAIVGAATLEALGGKPLSAVMADPARRAAELEFVRQAGSTREFELSILRPDGERRTVLDTTYSCHDPRTGDVFHHGILVDITMRKEHEDVLREQSVRDPLTGLYNRRYLDDLSARLSAADSSFGCVYIDIDDFKQFNETHGHQQGDSVLVRMSRFLLRQSRAEEAVIRVGGDEFVIVLEAAGTAEVELVVARLRRSARRTAPVPFSLGWAVRQPGEGLARTLDRADRNLLAVRVIERTSPRGEQAAPPEP